jgi:hypothetical protein
LPFQTSENSTPGYPATRQSLAAKAEQSLGKSISLSATQPAKAINDQDKNKLNQKTKQNTRKIQGKGCHESKQRKRNQATT